MRRIDVLCHHAAGGRAAGRQYTIRSGGADATARSGSGRAGARTETAPFAETASPSARAGSLAGPGLASPSRQIGGKRAANGGRLFQPAPTLNPFDVRTPLSRLVKDREQTGAQPISMVERGLRPIAVAHVHGQVVRGFRVDVILRELELEWTDRARAELLKAGYPDGRHRLGVRPKRLEPLALEPGIVGHSGVYLPQSRDQARPRLAVLVDLKLPNTAQGGHPQQSRSSAHGLVKGHDTHGAASCRAYHSFRRISPRMNWASVLSAASLSAPAFALLSHVLMGLWWCVREAWKCGHVGAGFGARCARPPPAVPAVTRRHRRCRRSPFR